MLAEMLLFCYGTDILYRINYHFYCVKHFLNVFIIILVIILILIISNTANQHFHIFLYFLVARPYFRTSLSGF